LKREKRRMDELITIKETQVQQLQEALDQTQHKINKY
jgi:hypothetical protein